MNDRIYANVWFQQCIVVIDPASGSVVLKIDCAGLVRQVDMMGSHDVLNGIAWDRKTNLFYITGKNWPLIFVVTIPE